MTKTFLCCILLPFIGWHISRYPLICKTLTICACFGYMLVDICEGQRFNQDMYLWMVQSGLIHWSYLDFARGLHHLEFGLDQLLFQFPNLSPEELLFLLPPPLLLQRGIFILLLHALFSHFLIFRLRSRFWVPTYIGRFIWIHDVLTVGASFYCTLWCEKKSVAKIKWYRFFSLKRDICNR